MNLVLLNWDSDLRGDKLGVSFGARAYMMFRGGYVEFL